MHRDPYRTTLKREIRIKCRPSSMFSQDLKNIFIVGQLLKIRESWYMPSKHPSCSYEVLHVMLTAQAQVHSIENFVVNNQTIAYENSFLHSWSPRLPMTPHSKPASGACHACKQKVPFQEIKSYPNLSTNTAIVNFSATCSSRAL
jgi:hypothetical protein